MIELGHEKAAGLEEGGGYRGAWMTGEAYAEQRAARSHLTQSLARRLLTIDAPERVVMGASESSAMLVGRVAHALILRDGETITDIAAVLPADHNGRTALGKATLAAARETGLPVLTYKDMETALAVSKAARANSTAAGWLAASQADAARDDAGRHLVEREFEWTDPVAEPPIRAAGQADLIVPARLGGADDGRDVLLVVDVKTQGRATSLQSWLASELYSASGQTCQPAAYIRGVAAVRDAGLLTGEAGNPDRPICFCYLVVQTTPPHEVWPVLVSEKYVAESLKNWKEAARIFRRHNENEWRSPDGLQIGGM